MTLIDCHLHINFLGFSLDDIIQYLDTNQIDCCWLLGLEELDPGPWPYQSVPIEDIYEAYLKYPHRIIPFYAPDPHSNDAAKRLEYWYQKGIRGCGELKATLNWESSDIRRILSTAEKLGIPVLFHMEESERRIKPRSSATFDRLLCDALQTKRRIYQIPQRVLRLLVDVYSPLRNRLEYYTFPGYMLDFASLEITLSDYSNVNFIAHGPMFWKYISADTIMCEEAYPKGPVVGEGIIWRLLRDYPNLYADISGYSGFNALVRDPSSMKRFLSLFGSKILYGTDNRMLGQRDFLDSLELSQETYENIYYRNACRLVNR